MRHLQGPGSGQAVPAGPGGDVHGGLGAGLWGVVGCGWGRTSRTGGSLPGREHRVRRRRVAPRRSGRSRGRLGKDRQPGAARRVGGKARPGLDPEASESRRAGRRVRGGGVRAAHGPGGAVGGISADRLPGHPFPKHAPRPRAGPAPCSPRLGSSDRTLFTFNGRFLVGFFIYLYLGHLPFLPAWAVSVAAAPRRGARPPEQGLDVRHGAAVPGPLPSAVCRLIRSENGVSSLFGCC